jgi:predicted glycoside hydrolase/deacetylase ChbG (UPF0249 family)
MTSIVLCADDYGLSPAVSAAIVDLAREKRLSATSCMVDFLEVPDRDAIAPLLDRIDIGLHITLTANRPLMKLMRDAYLRRLDREAVRAEVRRQLERFRQLFGRMPAHIDGHQHVHTLPIVREAALEAAKISGGYLRLTTDAIDAGMLARPEGFKALSLTMMSRALARGAAQRKVPVNTGFRGTRSFHEKGPFRALFKRMIEDVPQGAIVLCHPGHVDAVLKTRDSVTTAREDEYAYFKSDAFFEDLAARDISLKRFRDIAPT